MKNLIITGLAFFLTLNSFAQEKIKQREVGLSFRNFDEFGVVYKVGDEKALWRFNAVSLGGSEQRSENVDDSDEDDTDSYFGFGFGIGREFREVIVNSLEFRYGLDLRYSYSKDDNFDYNSSYNPDSKSNRLGLDFIVGLNYVVSDKFVLGAELTPGVSYAIHKYTIKNSDGDAISKSENKTFHYGLSNSSAQLSIAYRF